MRIHNNIKEFFHAHDGHIFRFWVYKKMFTPYEQDKKFSDESIYENEYCSYGRIVEVSPLPDGDILLAFQIDDNYENNNDIDYVTYHKLSEIQLDWSKQDQVEDESTKDKINKIMAQFGISNDEEETNNESINN